MIHSVNRANPLGPDRVRRGPECPMLDRKEPLMLRTFASAVVLSLLVSQSTAADPAPLRETARLKFERALPALPAQSFKPGVVSYPPGAKSVSHRHAPSAFIYAFVISGAVRSQVDDEPARVYQAGENWIELPGAHHVVSENASATEPAQLLAVFVVD